VRGWIAVGGGVGEVPQAADEVAQLGDPARALLQDGLGVGLELGPPRLAGLADLARLALGGLADLAGLPSRRLADLAGLVSGVVAQLAGVVLGGLVPLLRLLLGVLGDLVRGLVGSLEDALGLLGDLLERADSGAAVIWSSAMTWLTRPTKASTWSRS